MKHKLTIYQAGTAHVISDGGRIAGLLQLQLELPWELVAETPDHIADRIRQMEVLISQAEGRAAQGLIPLPAGGSGSGGVGVSGVSGGLVASGPFGSMRATASSSPGAEVSFNVPGEKSVQGCQSVDVLPIKRRYTWRLKRAGVKTIGQLAGMTEEALSKTPGVGPAVVAQAKRGMEGLGYRLA